MLRAMPSRGLIALFALSVAAPAFGQSKNLGTFEKWSAHEITEKSAKICFAHGEPAQKTGDYKERGAVYVQVSHRPHAKVANEVGFTAGYTFLKDSDAVVEIDGKKFTLFTHQDGAWAKNAKEDEDLVQAMKKGTRMLIQGTSSRNTKTVDTYSLIGFTAAHTAIGKACKTQ